MVKNYLLVAWRILKKNKLYNIINISGLSLAIAICLIITLYYDHENNYDNFLNNSAKIYSIYSRIKLGNDTIEFPLTNYTAGSTITYSSPAVKSYIRVYHPFQDVVIQNPNSSNIRFNESSFFFADSNFFSFFSFHLLYGNPSSVLKEPFSVVITQEAAKKYFGNINPIGKIVKYDSAYNFEITGIADNPPSNSNFKFEFIASLSSRLVMKGNDLILAQHGISYGDIQTFFLLSKPEEANNFESNIRRIASEKQSISDIKSVQYVIPLLKMHLHTKFGDVSNTKYLQIFPYVAFLILMIALINYINLTSAKTIVRAKEIAIRKVIGAGRKKIIQQFLIESIVYITTAFLGGIIFFFVTKGFFFDLLKITVDNAYAYNLHVLCIFTGIFVFSIVFSSAYPIYIFAVYKPNQILSNKLNKSGGVGTRKLLSVFQFSIAIGIITCSIIITRQLSFINKTDTGVERSNILIVPFKTTLHDNYNVFKEDVKNLSGVSDVATSRFPLYQAFATLTVSQKKTGSNISLPVFTVDNRFIALLKLNWEMQPKNDSVFFKNEIIINETAIDKLNLNANPIDQSIEIDGEEFQVKGVLKDFNYTSLTSKIDALAIFVKPDSINAWGSERDGCLYVKFYHNVSIPLLINSIKNIYNKYDQSSSFEFSFLDDAYQSMYKAEDKLAYIINIFTMITISMALLGSFGLASFSAEQRKKEIGIRRALGASVKSVVYLLIQDFIEPVLIAGVIGIPIAWLFMYNWLKGFAFRTPINIWIFIFSIVIILMLTILTTIFLSVKAAIMVNPVRNLRTE